MDHVLDPPYYKYLRTFGEITVTSTLVNKKVIAKTSNRGTLAIYLGRAQNHSADSYRLLKLDTMKVIISRNVKFTNLTYQDYYRHTEDDSNRYEPLSDDDDDAEEYTHPTQFTPTATTIENLITNPELLSATNKDSPSTTTVEPSLPTQQPKSSKLIRELRKLDGFYNPEVQQVLGSIQTSDSITATPPTDSPDDNPPIPTETDDTTAINTSTTDNDINTTINTTNMDTDIDTTYDSSTATATPTDPVPNEESTFAMIRECAMLMMCKNTAFLDSLLAMTTTQNIGPNNLSIDQIKDQSKNPFAVPMSQLKDILTIPVTFEDAYFDDHAWCRY
jgi:hypothetical protein